MPQHTALSVTMHLILLFILYFVQSVSALDKCTLTICGQGIECCDDWALGAKCYQKTVMVCTPDLARPSGEKSLCPVGSSACNSACFDPLKYYCSNEGKLELRKDGGPSPTTGLKKKTTKKTATTTKKSVKKTTKRTTTSKRGSPKPIISTTKRGLLPTTSKKPVITTKRGTLPTNRPAQTADLRMINSCSSPLWFEARWQGNPLPGQGKTITLAKSGEYVDYTVPDDGLESTRFWAKFGCDSTGRNCLIGDSMQYYPNGGCPPSGCSPAIDSLFEATWGCKPGSPCHSAKPTTWFDTTQVDGWTVPYRLSVKGEKERCDCNEGKCGFDGVDARNLSLDKCPTNEDLSWNGKWNFTKSGKPLRGIDLRAIVDGKIVGCLSPCKYLTFAQPWGLGEQENNGQAATWMCCPTPTPGNCHPENGCLLSPPCRAGPVSTTKFVQAVHKFAPGVYAYSYDDAVGLHACPAGSVVYEMEFCPEGSKGYPVEVV